MKAIRCSSGHRGVVNRQLAFETEAEKSARHPWRSLAGNWRKVPTRCVKAGVPLRPRRAREHTVQSEVIGERLSGLYESGEQQGLAYIGAAAPPAPGCVAPRRLHPAAGTPSGTQALGFNHRRAFRNDPGSLLNGRSRPSAFSLMIRRPRQVQRTHDRNQGQAQTSRLRSEVRVSVVPDVGVVSILPRRRHRYAPRFPRPFQA